MTLRTVAAVLAEVAVRLRRPAMMVGWAILLVLAGWGQAESMLEVIYPLTQR